MSDWLQIHGLADGELSQEERAQAEARLSTCAKSQAEFEAVQTLKQTLQDKCPNLANEDSWKKCQTRLDELERVKKVEGFVGRYAWAMCAVFFMTILVGASLSRNQGPRVHTGDVMRASAGLTPLPSPGSQAISEQQRWVRGIFNGVEPVQTQRVNLTGGAQGFLNGVPVTRLDIADGQGPMQLFVILGDRSLEEAGVDESQYVTVAVPQSKGIAWTDQGRTFLLVGNRNPGDLIKAANLVRSH